MTGYSGLVLQTGEPPRWWRFAAGALVESGEGYPDREEGEPVAALYPAGETTLFIGLGAGMSRAQAVAIGQRTASENLLSPVDTLHFASGAHLAVADLARFDRWLSAWSELDLLPEVVVPTQLVPPAPVTGFVMMQVGNETVLRGVDFASVADPASTPFVTTGQSIETLPQEDQPILIARAIERAEVDLRQGAFAVPRQWGSTRQLVTRSLILTGALLLVTLLTPLTLAMRLQSSAADIDRRSDDLARTVVAKEELDPQSALQRQMLGIRGPGAGFGPAATAVVEALKAHKDSSLAALSFDAQGTLRATVQASSEAGLTGIVKTLNARGFETKRGASAVANGVRRTELEARMK